MGKPEVGALHRLARAQRASTPEDVAASLVALHSTDPASVHLAVAARSPATVADVDRALHEDRSIVRVMGMRRTIWAVPVELVPVVAGACGRSIAAAERRRLVAAIEDQGIARRAGPWLAELEDATLAALAASGEALTTELTREVPALRTTVRIGGTSKWAADVGLGTRVVLLLAMEGRIVRMRPRGGWTSTQHRYAVAPGAGEPLPTADAQAELARRWLAAFGPLSEDPVGDLRWWAGWTAAATKQALAAAGDDQPPPPPRRPRPWAALVPSLDPTTMGWKARSWYLDDAVGRRLFDRSGNAGPAIWWDGEVVGGWTQRPGGEVVTAVLVDVGREATEAIEREAARMQAWLDASGAVVKPRFAGPLAKELLT